VAAEHQVAFQRRRLVALVRDALQRLLNAEAARVRSLVGAVVGLLLFPV
jgi:predicted component of type VI protein secretion system